MKLQIHGGIYNERIKTVTLDLGYNHFNGNFFEVGWWIIFEKRNYDRTMLNIFSESGIDSVKNDHKCHQNKKHLQNTDNIAYYRIKGGEITMLWPIM